MKNTLLEEGIHARSDLDLQDDTDEMMENKRLSLEWNGTRTKGEKIGSYYWLTYYRYNIENAEFAKGAYGKILLADDRQNNKKVVIKKIPQTTPERMITNEVRAGKFLKNHPNIVKMISHMECDDYHYLVFEYIKSLDMFTFLEKRRFAPLPEYEARAIILQIFRALEFIHANSIAHRDVKLENILVSENNQITLIDFGLCAFIEEGKQCKEWCGSDNYLAPEICRRTPYDGFKADIFSTGVVLFALLFGVFPFDNLRVNASMQVVKPIRTLKVSFPKDSKASDSAKNLVEKMLADDPNVRISLKEVLRHPWLTNIEKPTASPRPVIAPSTPASAAAAEAIACPTA